MNLELKKSKKKATLIGVIVELIIRMDDRERTPT